MTIELEEGERQAILLALAKLSITRPGWHPACLSVLAAKLGGLRLYEEFRAHGPDPIHGGFGISAKYRFRWHARGEECTHDITAQTYQHACMALALHHKSIYGENTPADFRIDLSRPEIAEES